jgi:N4-gp56 family major capsid protein
MAVNLAKKYSPKVSERFKLLSLTDAGVNQDYEWKGEQTVAIYSFPTVALGNYDRTAAANRFGTPAELQDTVQEMTVSQDKAFTFVVDKGNSIQSGGARNANKAMSRQVDEVIIPAVDTYRLATMATAAVAAGGTAVAVITASNAYSEFLKVTEYFGDNKVPMTNRIAWVKPSFYKFLKLDPSFIKNSDLGQQILIKGQVGEVDGIKIVMTPTSYFPAATEFIVAHKSVVTAPEVLRTMRILNDAQGYDGAVVEGRIIYDAFVQTSKNKGVYVAKNA